MTITIGTFNLNNLFSRFNFRASIDSVAPADPDVEIDYRFDEQAGYMLRTYKGRLVKGKDEGETALIAERIRRIDADILAVQEVEDISVLRSFNKRHLDGMYPHIVLIEGNDSRLIDVGVMSRLPIGAVTSFQTAEHPKRPGVRIFGRDLLAVEILDARRRRKLFTLYNTHLKSHFVDFREDPVAGRRRNDRLRRQQAETVARLISERERRGAKFVLAGDMNDGVASACLDALRTIEGARMHDALAEALETRPAKAESQGPGPVSPAWTYRRNPPGRDTPPEFSLIDQLWLSPPLAARLEGAWIDRRTRHGGDGSDHDPAWIALDL